MKKNLIALLLVLAVVTAGVFAANEGSDTSASFDVKTTVGSYNLVSVTSAKFEGSTLESWNTFLPNNAISQAVAISGNTLAYANVITNAKNGVNVYVTASKMASGTAGQEGGNNYKVDYTVTVNGTSFATATETANKLFLAATASKATTSLFVGSYPVTAAVAETSFNNAPEDTYTGTITFTFSAT